MDIHRLKRCVFGAGVIILFTASCNQMDTVLPSAGTYQVDALNGGLSLNDYSVIADGDTIHPYFVNPVVNDPDLRTLALYIEDSGGKVLGRRVLYSPKASPAPSAPPEDGLIPTLPLDLVSEEEAGGAEGEAAEAGAVFPDDDITIQVKNFAGKLPPFPLPDELEIGAYSLVFEIRGEHTVLSRMSQPFYYIGSREFAAGEIRHYLPGFYGNSRLIPPGLTVMLEAQADYGEDLDPYVVWYNGKTKIGEGFAAEGALRLLWTAPARPGFHTIRAELFPFRPGAGQKGKIKEFSLPVSQKSEPNSGTAAGGYLYWYRFAGDLLDAKTGKGLNLVQSNKFSPAWYPAEQVYGLALDDGEGYEVPGCFLELPESGGGELGFFVRAIPLKDGRIFSARLGSSLTISLFLEGGALLLDLSEQEKTSRISNILPESGRGPAFTGAFVTVKFDKLRAGASLVLGDPGLDEVESFWAALGNKNTPIQTPSEWAEIGLDRPVNGELHSWIGAAELPKPEKKTNLREESPVSDSPVKSAGPVLVLDDFAAMFRAGKADDLFFSSAD
jgi:hypothetical protein